MKRPFFISYTIMSSKFHFVLVVLFLFHSLSWSQNYRKQYARRIHVYEEIEARTQQQREAFDSLFQELGKKRHSVEKEWKQLSKLDHVYARAFRLHFAVTFLHMQGNKPFSIDSLAVVRRTYFEQLQELKTFNNLFQQDLNYYLDTTLVSLSSIEQERRWKNRYVALEHAIETGNEVISENNATLKVVQKRINLLELAEQKLDSVRVVFNSELKSVYRLLDDFTTSIEHAKSVYVYSVLKDEPDYLRSFFAGVSRSTISNKEHIFSIAGQQMGFRLDLDALPPVYSNMIPDRKVSVYIEDMVKQEAQYAASRWEYKDYLLERIKVSEDFVDSDAIISVFILNEGSVYLPCFLKAEGWSEELQQKVLQTLNEMPPWLPATINGKDVSSELLLEFGFHSSK